MKSGTRRQLKHGEQLKLGETLLLHVVAPQAAEQRWRLGAMILTLLTALLTLIVFVRRSSKLKKELAAKQAEKRAWKEKRNGNDRAAETIWHFFQRARPFSPL